MSFEPGKVMQRFKSRGGGASKPQGGRSHRDSGRGGRGRGRGGQGRTPQAGLGRSLFKESMLSDPWLPLTASLVHRGVLPSSHHSSFACGLSNAISTSASTSASFSVSVSVSVSVSATGAEPEVESDNDHVNEDDNNQDEKDGLHAYQQERLAHILGYSATGVGRR